MVTVHLILMHACGICNRLFSIECGLNLQEKLVSLGHDVGPLEVTWLTSKGHMIAESDRLFSVDGRHGVIIRSVPFEKFDAATIVSRSRMPVVYAYKGFDNTHYGYIKGDGP